MLVSQGENGNSQSHIVLMFPQISYLRGTGRW